MAAVAGRSPRGEGPSGAPERRRARPGHRRCARGQGSIRRASIKAQSCLVCLCPSAPLSDDEHPPGVYASRRRSALCPRRRRPSLPRRAAVRLASWPPRPDPPARSPVPSGGRTDSHVALRLRSLGPRLLRRIYPLFVCTLNSHLPACSAERKIVSPFARAPPSP